MSNQPINTYKAIEQAAPGDIVILRNVQITGFICGHGYKCNFVSIEPNNKIKVDINFGTTNNPVYLILSMRYIAKILKMDTREVIFEHSFEDAL